MQYPIAYMVAGLSSRFNGNIKALTKVGPNLETLIELSMDRAINAGFNKIIFIVGEQTEKPFKDFFKENYKKIQIEYTLQTYHPNLRDKPWGTADAACKVIPLINGPCVIATGDDLYSEETYKILFNHLKSENTNATVGYPLKDHIPKFGEVNRGIFEIDDNYVTSAKEVYRISIKNYSDKMVKLDSPCNIGIFLLQKETLEKVKQNLDLFKEQNKNNRSIECYINVELGKLINTENVKLRYYPGEGNLLGLTNPDDVDIVKKTLKQSL